LAQDTNSFNYILLAFFVSYVLQTSVCHNEQANPVNMQKTHYYTDGAFTFACSHPPQRQ